MNLLFHRHLARRDSGSDLAGFGAMLPDLWAMADRRLRPKPEPAWPSPAQRLRGAGERPSERDKLDALLWGIDHHLALDTLFHRGPLLKEGEAVAIRLLKEARIAGEKVLLFGHVAWEICLDGALLRRLGLVATKNELRRELAALGPEALVGALAHHTPDLEAGDRRAADEAILGMLHQLTWGQWIDGYLDGEGITQRLQGVRRRLRLAPLDQGDQDKCARALDLLLEQAESRLDEALALEPAAPAHS